MLKVAALGLLSLLSGLSASEPPDGGVVLSDPPHGAVLAQGMRGIAKNRHHWKVTAIVFSEYDRAVVVKDRDECTLDCETKRCRAYRYLIGEPRTCTLAATVWGTTLASPTIEMIHGTYPALYFYVTEERIENPPTNFFQDGAHYLRYLNHYVWPKIYRQSGDVPPENFFTVDPEDKQTDAQLDDRTSLGPILQNTTERGLRATGDGLSGAPSTDAHQHSTNAGTGNNATTTATSDAVAVKEEQLNTTATTVSKRGEPVTHPPTPTAPLPLTPSDAPPALTARPIPELQTPITTHGAPFTHGPTFNSTINEHEHAETTAAHHDQTEEGGVQQSSDGPKHDATTQWNAVTDDGRLDTTQRVAHANDFTGSIGEATGTNREMGETTDKLNKGAETQTPGYTTQETNGLPYASSSVGVGAGGETTADTSSFTTPAPTLFSTIHDFSQETKVHESHTDSSSITPEITEYTRTTGSEVTKEPATSELYTTDKEPSSPSSSDRTSASSELLTVPDTSASTSAPDLPQTKIFLGVVVPTIANCSGQTCSCPAGTNLKATKVTPKATDVYSGLNVTFESGLWTVYGSSRSNRVLGLIAKVDCVKMPKIYTGCDYPVVRNGEYDADGINCGKTNVKIVQDMMMNSCNDPGVLRCTASAFRCEGRNFSIAYVDC